MRGRDTLLIEDNPYGELRFMGKPAAPMISYLGDSVLSLGSFSKVFAPSMRLGWVAAQPEIIDHLISLKQASDLHTNYFSQRVLHQYLADNDFDAHIAQIREGYKRQRDRMVGRLKAELPAGVSVTEPEGGMFLWLTLPAEMSSSELFEKALAEKVVFVPGVPFYDDVVEHNTLRLNYSNSSVDEIDRGVHALVKAMGDLS
jgi:2-aminoadipate transaminase